MRGEFAVQLARLAVIIVTYNPSADLAATVDRIVGQGVGEVIIVDNSPDGSTATVAANGFERSPQIIVNMRNLGIAKALNQGIELARRLDYEWVCTMDQDSIPADGFFSQMAQIASRRIDDIYPLAVLGPNYFERKLQRVAHETDNGTDAIQVRDVITSGSFISVAAFTKVDGFDEKLFIDMVDTDFCFRIRQAGYSIWRTKDPLMEHSVGELTPKRFLGMRFNVTNHMPQRRYYIFRNTLYMVRKYCLYDPRWAFSMLCSYLPKVFVKACVFEKLRRQNFQYICLGIFDALTSAFSRKVL